MFKELNLILWENDPYKVFPNQLETSTTREIVSSETAAIFLQLPKRTNADHLVF